MISAWIYYFDGKAFRLEERNGARFNSTIPTEWGLAADCTILLVFQHASFQQAWSQGVPVKQW